MQSPPKDTAAAVQAHTPDTSVPLVLHTMHLYGCLHPCGCRAHAGGRLASGLRLTTAHEDLHLAGPDGVGTLPEGLHRGARTGARSFGGRRLFWPRLQRELREATGRGALPMKPRHAAPGSHVEINCLLACPTSADPRPGCGDITQANQQPQPAQQPTWMMPLKVAATSVKLAMPPPTISERPRPSASWGKGGARQGGVPHQGRQAAGRRWSAPLTRPCVGCAMRVSRAAGQPAPGLAVAASSRVRA